MLTKEQIEERRKFIGGSECAAVLGLSRWNSPLGVWMEKTGQAAERDLSDNFAIEMGNELEDVVVRLFEKRTGLKTRRVNDSIRHPKYPFIGAHIDRRIVGTDAILEAKTCSAYKSHEWEGEEIPREYVLQVMHYLAVTGMKVGYIACLIGGNKDFVWKAIQRDEDMIKSILEKEVSFWNDFVLTGTMPMTITHLDGDNLFQMFPKQNEGQELQLGDDIAKILEARDAYLADKRTVEKELEKMDNQIKAALQEAESAKVGAWRISWKRQERTGLDGKKLQEEKPDICKQYEKKSIYRMLRVTKGKGE